jgi:hypothetical protein
VGYPESPLNAGSESGLAGPKPGQRVLTDLPFGAGGEPRFALMAKGEEAAGLIGRYESVLETALRPPPDPDGIWLVRPDGYVAAVAWKRDPSAIERCLDRLTK